jgi:hypothetical protein
MRRAAFLLGGCLATWGAWAQAPNPPVVPPLEIRQDSTPYNLQSTNGVPISSTIGSPPGSDGRVPSSQPAGMTQLPPTPNQFQGMISFGALATPGVDRTNNLNSSLSYAANAKNLDLPRSEINGQVIVAMPFARVGAPLLSRKASTLFGEVIPVPELAEDGNPLPSSIEKDDYWQAEPYRPVTLTTNDILSLAVFAEKLQTAADPVSQYLVEQFYPAALDKLAAYPATTDDATLAQALVAELNRVVLGASVYDQARFTNRVLPTEALNLRPDNPIDDPPVRLNRLLLEAAYPGELAQTATSYYWSPHARAVFAIQPGPVLVTWKKRAPSASPPAGKYSFEAGNYYALYDRLYVISGSAVKTPRKIYWTEGVFRNLGWPVMVPAGQVGVVNVVFNSNFPQRVAKEYQQLGQTPLVADSSKMLQETRTLWYDQQLRQILAYNQEGRVFMELLGGTGPDGRSRQFLGFEVVDVSREANPADVTIELGERLSPYPPAELRADAGLYPEMIQQVSTLPYAVQHLNDQSAEKELYATRETHHLNDLLVHWLERGSEGLQWPFRFVRYSLVWPSDVTKYSHYMRPWVSSEAEAKATAIPLPPENSAVIDYQDPLDKPRAKISGDFSFYTYLEPKCPAHRTLLRFTVGGKVAFERVFSWLDQNLKATNFAGTIATNLAAWNPGEGTFSWPNEFASPRLVSQTVDVGQRILAPGGELGSETSDGYMAGYIHQVRGTSFDVNAYFEPFSAGFDKANVGAIIPVNVIPGTNQLEVWWFRKSSLDTSKGFKPVYWPSIIGTYHLQWPSDPSEIVLASNDGSGPLNSMQARGYIYYQNDSSQPGYNPNEEHALMQGGQVYALRDDLNITDPTGYSSHPYVLLEYTEVDGRPAMRVFKVLREKPEQSLVFEYPVSAGTIVQPPMPLPLLEKPLAPSVQGEPPRSLNQELSSWLVSSNATSDSSGLVRIWTTDTPLFQTYSLLSLQNLSDPSEAPLWFYPASMNVSSNRVEGFVSDSLPYALSSWGATWPTNVLRWRYGIEDPSGLGHSKTVILAHPISRTNWTGTVTETNSAGGAFYVEVEFSGTTPELAKSASVLVLPQGGVTEDQCKDWLLAPEYIPSAQQAYAAFTLQDRKGNLWIYRGPHREVEQPQMTMQFYYKTLSGFFFPGRSYDAQPPVGTVTPYLRAVKSDGTYEGNAVYGNSLQQQTGDGNALGIAYRPYWPEGVPVLQMAESLTLPKHGLPAVRGQSSVEIAYQQSQCNGGWTNRAAILHDPTREKTFELGLGDDDPVLGKIPDSVKTQSYRGKTYFPNLPPHLSERFFFDPNRGRNGALVFRGQFVNEAVGEKYLLLNALGEQDVEYLKELCRTGDPNKAKWDGAVAEGLSTNMELFRENPAKPGTYVATSAVGVGPSALCEVTSPNVAVDSYALTAVGPGVGYVTLVVGNGRAFTPEGDPVSLYIIRVVDTLFRGEVKVIASSNPLNEKLTLQQVVDLAGAAQDYSFEWKIAAPVDGLPPVVYENQRVSLIGDGAWNHLHFPVATDQIATLAATATQRSVQDVRGTLVAVRAIPFNSVTTNDLKLHFVTEQPVFGTLANGTRVTMRDADGVVVYGTVTQLVAPRELVVAIDSNQTSLPSAFQVLELAERVMSDHRQSVVYREFTVPAGKEYSQCWLSLDLDAALGARVYLDGQEVVVANRNEGNSSMGSAPAGLSALSRAYRLGSEALAGGLRHTDSSTRHQVVVELFSQALPGTPQSFNLHLDAYESVDKTAENWLALDATRYRDGIRAILGGTADVRSLADNYVIMRYRADNTNHASWKDDGACNNIGWSQWTEPQLAEGWIKRVLAGINPFNQRVNDLFNNQVNTDVSMLTQAGRRWEGDIALNLDAINDSGLIEIYETVLRRGRMLCIDAGINYGPANDALLLAAGYLNDLYLMLGNEAWADAANPTIGIGTTDHTYGDVATALFSFKGQLDSLLGEELALLRGRDDFLQPGVETAPVYNRMFWNYTRGIDAGEVIYALNYNIVDHNQDGVVNAADAAIMFPQGHGDAYGHYLTAVAGYYSLLLDNDFDWVPKTEAVTVLGKPVQVGYQNERKFASAAAAMARTGRQIFDLTWRKDYSPGKSNGWEHFSTNRTNTRRTVPSTRSWGMDPWASRAGQGAYLNWVVGNAILPDVDSDPAHEGIQIIDRTTVPELKELTTLASGLQTAMDNAEAGLTPLGLPENAVPFDLNPNTIVGGENTTHFEQVYQKATTTLLNAVAAFDDAKDVTRLMRSEQDSLDDFVTSVDKKELAYANALIELYGTPYPDDIGPGKTYPTAFTGPDLLHYMYIDLAELAYPGMLDPQEDSSFRIDLQSVHSTWLTAVGYSYFDFIVKAKQDGNDAYDPQTAYVNNTNLYLEYNLSSHGFFGKPATWQSKRASPGEIQQAVSDIVKARNSAYLALYNIEGAKGDLDWALRAAEWKRIHHGVIFALQTSVHLIDKAVALAQLVYDIAEKFADETKQTIEKVKGTTQKGLPTSVIVGVANGGDISAPARVALEAAGYAVTEVLDKTKAGWFTAMKVTDYLAGIAKLLIEDGGIETENWLQEERDMTNELRDKVFGVQNLMPTVNEKLQELDDAQRKYRSLLAEGDRIQQEREIFRQRAAAAIQGYRTRDAAFRIFRNEKLERYKSLFDLAARYSFMAAQAFDYETGLLYTEQGKEFIRRIVSSRALGVIRDGEPQYAGSNAGDPGLSSALAEMHADWLVLKGRLGFNNPDSYGTTVSLRKENFRILTGTDGDLNWKDTLNRGKRANLLEDSDVREYCMQIDAGNGLPVPGIVIEFSTTIADGANLFGRPLAPGDHSFSSSSFATKIFAVGVAFEGYLGMDNPTASSSSVAFAGGSSPVDPSTSFLDPKAMSATPYVYLIPVGVDSMRSPPLGDASVVRTWNVADVSIPLPMNIGGSDFSTKRLWQSSESLTEKLFAIRKHQAFRPVSTADAFSLDIYGGGSQLSASQFTNRRLIGRSVWNSRWKLVIPGQTLLNDPNQGLDRFIQTVKDVKLHFVTYSYSGN